MNNRRNYYRVLQVQVDAQLEVIRGSFRTLMRDLKQHPDLGGSHSAAVLLNEACETLTDPGRRADYDRTLHEQHTKGSTSAGLQRASCPICARSSGMRSPVKESNREGNTAGYESPSRSPGKEGWRTSRRSADRLQRDEHITYSAGSQNGKAQMVNFSPGGMLILAGESLPVTSVIRLSSFFLEASACVTHCEERAVRGKRLYAIGVTFTSVRFDVPAGGLLSVTA